MEINWGMRIAIFYSCFVLVMVSMVVFSLQNKTQLVEDNYYNKDLNYESFRIKRQNATNLKTKVAIDFNLEATQLNIKFPDANETYTGIVTLYRPSDKHADRSYKIVINNDGIMSIPIKYEVIKKGLWVVQVDWNSRGLEYYIEESIFI